MLSNNEISSNKYSDIVQRLSIGLLAITLVIVQGYFTAPSLDGLQTFSVIAFAMATPCLAYNIINYHIKPNKYNFVHRIVAPIVIFGGILFDFVGIMAAFMHISLLAGSMFGFCSLIVAELYTKSHRSSK